MLRRNLACLRRRPPDLIAPSRRPHSRRLDHRRRSTGAQRAFAQCRPEGLTGVGCWKRFRVPERAAREASRSDCATPGTAQGQLARRTNSPSWPSARAVCVALRVHSSLLLPSARVTPHAARRVGIEAFSCLMKAHRTSLATRTCSYSFQSRLPSSGAHHLFQSAANAAMDFDRRDNEVYSRRAGRRCSATAMRHSRAPDWRSLVTRTICTARNNRHPDHVAGKTPIFERHHRCAPPKRRVALGHQPRVTARVTNTGGCCALGAWELDITDRKLYESAVPREVRAADQRQSIGDGASYHRCQLDHRYINPVAGGATPVGRLEEAHAVRGEIFRASL